MLFFYCLTVAAKRCPVGFVYTECTSQCPRTCSRLYAITPENCYKNCVPGCECESGTVLDQGRCVEPKKCSCTYRNENKPAGSTIVNDCNKW